MHRYLIGLNQDETHFCCFIPIGFNISIDRIKQLFSFEKIIEMGLCYPKPHGFVNFIAGANIKPSERSLGNVLLNELLEEGDKYQIKIKGAPAFICGYKNPSYFTSILKRVSIPSFSELVIPIEDKESLVHLLIETFNNSYGGNDE